MKHVFKHLEVIIQKNLILTVNFPVTFLEHILLIENMTTLIQDVRNTTALILPLFCQADVILHGKLTATHLMCLSYGKKNF